MSTFRNICLLLFWFASAFAVADGPKDNAPANVRPVPPPGITLDEATRTELTRGLKELQDKVTRLRRSQQPLAVALLPDVEIFSRAIEQSLEHNELFSKSDIKKAQEVLMTGHLRADALLGGNAPWTREVGLVVRGFRSRIDDTVQPYGLEIPPSQDSVSGVRQRLDVWLHGRGERSVETQFIFERMHRPGRFAPSDTIVLHPFGRYCNAFKFAGETDILEAIESASGFYRIDSDRISIRGFSMGGAGCWQMAVHYPDRFFAANPGAGFSETEQFLRTFQAETLDPTWYERKLWQWYDCTGYAENLINLPTIAYSGELDRQKQAADIMELALRKERIELTHIIGPGTEHSIHPDSVRQIDAKMAQLARRGRDDRPQHVVFTTPTLRYDRSHWIQITRLHEHWQPAKVSAAFIDSDSQRIGMTVAGVKALRLKFPAGAFPSNAVTGGMTVEIDTYDTPQDFGNSGKRLSHQELTCSGVQSDRSWVCDLYHDGQQWKQGVPPETGLVKRHGLQGPIDDAFTERFILVRPTGQAFHQAPGQWAEHEWQRMKTQWRQHFRGDAIERRDTDITPEDIQTANLILFGDPGSNAVLAKIADQLPIRWDQSQITVGEKQYDAQHHGLAMIYPNPLNPQRYVVLGSGFTYRQYAYLNNARQVPKLPDWAIVDVRQKPDALWPGNVVDANFFDEAWQLKPATP